MNLKENMTSIKEEISTEEQFFESFFKVEKFYKKYKFVLIGLVVAIVAFFIISAVVDFVSEKNETTANEAYTKVLLNSKDTASIEALKESNEKLLAIALYQISQEKTEAKDVEYLQDIAAYNSAVAKGDVVALDVMILSQDFLLKDFALLSKTLILIEKQEYKKAKETISKVDPKSQILPLADMISHFLLTK